MICSTSALGEGKLVIQYEYSDLNATHIQISKSSPTMHFSGSGIAIGHVCVSLCMIPDSNYWTKWNDFDLDMWQADLSTWHYLCHEF